MNTPVTIAASRTQTSTLATGATFLGLSGYALTTRKNFSFMNGEK